MPINRSALAQPVEPRKAQPAPVKDQSRVVKPLPEPEKKKGIFDKAVAEIVRDAQYLTADNIVALQKLLPVQSSGEGINAGDIDLSDLLDTLMKLQKRMQLTGLTSNDPAEIKSMIQSTKTVIELVRKHQEAVSAQARLLALENATVEALDALGNDDIKPRFLALLRQKLAGNEQK